MWRLLEAEPSLQLRGVIAATEHYREPATKRAIYLSCIDSHLGRSAITVPTLHHCESPIRSVEQRTGLARVSVRFGEIHSAIDNA